MNALTRAWRRVFPTFHHRSNGPVVIDPSYTHRVHVWGATNQGEP